LDSVDHPALPVFVNIMVLGVIPLTAIALITVAIMEKRIERKKTI
jgi:hypothetical protein